MNEIRKPVDLYLEDFYSWALRQAELLRAGKYELVDIDNVAEELESLGRGEARLLKSHYRTLLLHLLKWVHQPGRRTRSWELSIHRARIDADEVIADNPGLKPRIEELYASAYKSARLQAAAETRLSLKRFPEANPFPYAQAMAEDWLPE